MGEDCGGVVAGEEFVGRLAAHGDFSPRFDDRFDALQREAAEAADQNIAEAEALGAHGRAVGQREDVVRRDVERFAIRKMEADECVGVANFQARDARPGFSVRVAWTAKVLAHLARFNLDDTALFRLNRRSGAQTASAASA